MNDDVVAEQIAYYRARAAEYDDWWERRHEYDDGPEFAAGWERDIDVVRSWLDDASPLGRVLELAAGTGNWTRELAPRSTHITAVDASPEVLAVNAEKVGVGANVDHVVADLFTWEPDQRYDTIFFSFWLSHVPTSESARFWRVVGKALEPGGRVLLLDNARRDHAIANSPPRRRDGGLGAAVPADRRLDAEHETRSLRDATEFTIVKRYWTPDELAAELAGHGWTAALRETSFAFIYGTATPTA